MAFPYSTTNSTLDLFNSNLEKKITATIGNLYESTNVLLYDNGDPNTNSYMLNISNAQFSIYRSNINNNTTVFIGRQGYPSKLFSSNISACNVILNNISAYNIGIGTTFANQILTVNGQGVFSSNVGVGTTWARQTLEVTGFTYFSSNVGLGTLIANQMLTVNGQGVFSSNVGVGTTWARQTLEVTGFTYLSSNVGLGTLIANQMLTVNGQGVFSSNIGVGTTYARTNLDVIGWSLFSSNVGVGTTYARQSLDVAGQGVFSTNVGIGTTYAIDALHLFSGNANFGNNNLSNITTVTTQNLNANNIAPQTGSNVSFGYNNITNLNNIQVLGTIYTSNIAALGSLITVNQYETFTNSNLVINCIVPHSGTALIVSQSSFGSNYNASNINTNVAVAAFFGTDGGLTPGAGRSVPVLYVASNASVGINTYAPIANFDVRGTTYFSSNLGLGTTFANQMLTVNGQGVFSSNVGVGTTYARTNLDVIGWSLFSSNVGVGTTYARQSLDVAGQGIFSSNIGIGTTYARQTLDLIGQGIFSSNIGIGVINPQKTLDINGDINFTGNIFKNYQNFITSQWSNIGTTVSILCNIGIGTTYAIQPLHVQSNAYFASNIGIGTTIPRKTLDVQGSVNISSNIFINNNQLYDLPGDYETISNITGILNPNKASIITSYPWYQFLQSSSNIISIAGIATENNIYGPNTYNYIFGNYSGILPFSNSDKTVTTTLTSTSPISMFIAKYDNYGFAQWATSIDFSGTPQPSTSYTDPLTGQQSLYNLQATGITYNPVNCNLYISCYSGQNVDNVYFSNASLSGSSLTLGSNLSGLLAYQSGAGTVAYQSGAGTGISYVVKYTNAGQFSWVNTIIPYSAGGTIIPISISSVYDTLSSSNVVYSLFKYICPGPATSTFEISSINQNGRVVTNNGYQNSIISSKNITIVIKYNENGNYITPLFIYGNYSINTPISLVVSSSSVGITISTCQNGGSPTNNYLISGTNSLNGITSPKPLSTNFNQIYNLKYSHSNFSSNTVPIFVASITGDTNINSKGIYIDSNENMYVYGNFTQSTAIKLYNINSSNCVTAGFSTQNKTLWPTTSAINSATDGYNLSFITKFDINGNISTYKNTGNSWNIILYDKTNNSYIQNISVFGNNLYISGNYTNNSNLNILETSNVTSITNTSISLIPITASNIYNNKNSSTYGNFILAFNINSNISNDGSFLWSASIDGTNNGNSIGSNMIIDAFGNLVIMGSTTNQTSNIITYSDGQTQILSNISSSATSNGLYQFTIPSDGTSTSHLTKYTISNLSSNITYQTKTIINSRGNPTNIINESNIFIASAQKSNYTFNLSWIGNNNKWYPGLDGGGTVTMGSRIGIGTTYPRQSLDVIGQGIFSSNIGIGTTYARTNLDVNTAYISVGIIPFALIGGSLGNISTVPITNASLNVYGQSILTSNVGIGTTFANQMLTVNGQGIFSSNIGIGTTYARTNLDVIGLSLFSSNVGFGTTYARTNLDVIGLSLFSSNVGFGTTYAIQPFHVQSNAYFACNIGIGTTYARTNLDVIGLSLFSSNVGFGTTYAIQPFHVQSNAYFACNIGIGTTYARTKLDVIGLSLFSSNVGFGTTYAIQPFHVQSNAYFACNIGIGTTYARTNLDVIGLSLFSSNVGFGTTYAIQSFHVQSNAYFACNIGIGTTYAQAQLHIAGNTYMSSCYNIGIGTTIPRGVALDVNGTSSYAGSVTIGTTTTNQPLIVNGQGVFTSNIGIGTTIVPSQWSFYVANGGTFLGGISNAGGTPNNYPGTLVMTGDVIGFTGTSDQRLKENISNVSVSNILEKINNINIVEFDWKKDIYNKQKAGTHDFGLIAQNVESILPHTVYEFSIPPENIPYKRIQYEKIIPYLINSIQEQNKIISKLQDDIKILYEKIN